MTTEPVILNVYNMYLTNELNEKFCLLPGVFHSAVEVYNTEYLYGTHCFPFSGIMAIEPRSGAALCPGYHLRLSKECGQTACTRDEVVALARRLGETDFRGDQYHLLTKNCNNFSEEFTKILCGNSIPLWVNGLATVIWSPVCLYRYLKHEVLLWPGLRHYDTGHRQHHHRTNTPPARRPHKVRPVPLKARPVPLQQHRLQQRPTRVATRTRLAASKTMPAPECRDDAAAASSGGRPSLSTTDTWPPAPGSRREPKQSYSPRGKHRPVRHKCCLHEVDEEEVASRGRRATTTPHEEGTTRGKQKGDNIRGKQEGDNTRRKHEGDNIFQT